MREALSKIFLGFAWCLMPPACVFGLWSALEAAAPLLVGEGTVASAFAGAVMLFLAAALVEWFWMTGDLLKAADTESADV